MQRALGRFYDRNGDELCFFVVFIATSASAAALGKHGGSRLVAACIGLFLVVFVTTSAAAFSHLIGGGLDRRGVRLFLVFVAVATATTCACVGEGCSQSKE